MINIRDLKAGEEFWYVKFETRSKKSLQVPIKGCGILKVCLISFKGSKSLGIFDLKSKEVIYYINKPSSKTYFNWSILLNLHYSKSEAILDWNNRVQDMIMNSSKSFEKCYSYLDRSIKSKNEVISIVNNLSPIITIKDLNNITNKDILDLNLLDGQEIELGYKFDYYWQSYSSLVGLNFYTAIISKVFISYSKSENTYTLFYKRIFKDLTLSKTNTIIKHISKETIEKNRDKSLVLLSQIHSNITNNTYDVKNFFHLIDNIKLSINNKEKDYLNDADSLKIIPI